MSALKSRAKRLSWLKSLYTVTERLARASGRFA
jgi:hypothetical protein